MVVEMRSAVARISRVDITHSTTPRPHCRVSVHQFLAHDNSTLGEAQAAGVAQFQGLASFNLANQASLPPSSQGSDAGRAFNAVRGNIGLMVALMSKFSPQLLVVAETAKLPH